MPVRDLHPFIERDIRQVSETRSHHPLLCCDHDWQPSEEIEVEEGETGYECANVRTLGGEQVPCGAACARDSRGTIICYDVPVKLEWYEERPDSREAQTGRAA